MIQRCWRLYESYGHASNGPDQSDTSRIVYQTLSGAFDLDMVLHCKWFMLPMTLDMPDEGTR